MRECHGGCCLPVVVMCGRQVVDVSSLSLYSVGLAFYIACVLKSNTLDIPRVYDWSPLQAQVLHTPPGLYNPALPCPAVPCSPPASLYPTLAKCHLCGWIERGDPET